MIKKTKKGSINLNTFSEIFVRRYPWRIHFFNETIDYRDIKVLIKFFLKNYPLQEGDFIEEYEKKFVQKLDSSGYAFSFGSGRMALYAILEALNIGGGDEVIVPAFTCNVVINSLLYRDIKPVYYDIETETYGPDPESIESLITPKTKAIIAQHSFGIPCKIDRINEIAEENGIYLIEDCAHAMGARYNGKPLGTWGIASFFSSDQTKVFSTQLGGMAYTTDKEVAEKLRGIQSISPHIPKSSIINLAFQIFISYFLRNPYVHFLGRYIFMLGYGLKIFFDFRDDQIKFERPFNYPAKLSNLQSYLGINQLEKLGENISLRREMAFKYLEILKNKGVELDYNYGFPIFLRFPLMVKNRDEFVKKWRKYFEVGDWFDEVIFGRHYPPEKAGYKPGTCPVTEFVTQHIINFPTYQTSKRIQNFLYKVMESIDKEDIITKVPMKTPCCW